MDGTPQFLTDVKFAERRKGYDPEQVDNYLAQISDRVAQLQDMVREATARADEADAKVADAKRAQYTAEAQVDKLKADVERLEGSGARLVDEAAEVEQASKVLLMAQKTADATVHEANQTAEATRRDAQLKADTLVAEAEAEAEKLRSEARRQIDELVQQRRTEVLSEVGSLEKVRDEVAADVEALQRHIETQRLNVRAGIESLQRVLDDPAALRAHHPPTLSDASLAFTAPAPAAEGEGEAETAEAPESEPDVLDQDDEAADTVVVVPDDEPAADEPSDEGGLGLSDAEADFPAVQVPELLADAADQQGDDQGAADDQGADIDLTTDRLFEPTEDRTTADEGPPTELFTPFADDDAPDREDPLGQPDDEADAAMRAFFEADFGPDEEPKKSRWRR